jgi:DNA-binding NarL/FixJ family response regulator
MNNGKQISLEDVHKELKILNRLAILSLVREGLQQKDIAATLGVSNSVVSEMFPKGLLKRAAHSAKPFAGDEA